MNRKKMVARVAAGFLSIVTLLSSAIGPVPALAADPDADAGYMEDYPELREVRDMLDEDEIVEADDITVDADEDFEIEKDFKGIDYSSKKVKISLYDDDGFSSSKEGSYKPVYHADPRSGNHGYRFSRRITVVKKEEKKEAISSGVANGAGSGSESHGEKSPENEEGDDDAEEENESEDLDDRTESDGEALSKEGTETGDPEMDEPEKDLSRADDGNGSTADKAAVLQEEGTAGEEASASAKMKDQEKEQEKEQENGSLPAEAAGNADKDSTAALAAEQADVPNESEKKKETDVDIPENTSEGNTAATVIAPETEADKDSSTATEADTDSAANESSTVVEVVAERSGDETASEGNTDEAAKDATTAGEDKASEDATVADAEKAAEDATVAGADKASEDVTAEGADEAAAAGTDQAAADATAAGTKEVPAEESGKSVQEIVMTVEEFETAFEKVTAPALGASTSKDNASGAKIVSKEDEIDYEDLGIGEDVSGHLGHTTPVTVVDDDGNTYVGICAVPDDRGWNKGSELPEVSRVTDSLIIKYYYYTMLDSYGEDLARSRGFGSNSKEVAIAACHEAIGERYAQLAGIEYERPNVGSNLRALISAYKSGAAAKPLPDVDHVFIYASGRINVDGHWRQSYVFGRVEEEEPSNIVLRKVSSDSDMRWAYSAYYISYFAA